MKVNLRTLRIFMKGVKDSILLASDPYLLATDPDNCSNWVKPTEFVFF